MLLWTVLGSSGIGIFGVLRGGSGERRGWLVAFGLVIGATLGMMLSVPEQAGYLGALLWVLMILVPLFGYRAVQRLLTEQQYGAAATMTALLQVVHPSRHWYSQARLWKALAAVQRGDIDAGMARLNQLANEDTLIGHEAICHRLRLEHRWRDLLEWLERHYALQELVTRPAFTVLYMRALGELGELSRLVETYRYLSTFIVGSGIRQFRQQVQLFVTAFCGRADLVPRLFTGQLAGNPPELQRYWLAVAFLAAGASHTGRRMLMDLREEATPLVRASIDYRLARPINLPGDHLNVYDWQLLRDIERDIEEIEEESLQDGAVPHTSGVIEILVALNVVVFIGEILNGGSTNELTLLRMGALVSGLVIEQGQWWRVIAAMFLHWGLLHVVVNMLGLYIFGPYVAAVLGRLRFLVVYFGAGIGSMLLIVLVNHLSGVQEMVVGASGCIMGLVGATGAIFWRLWRRQGSQYARERLVLVAMIIGFQTIFDLSTPQVSFLAHFSGAIIGLLLTSMLPHKHPVAG